MNSTIGPLIQVHNQPSLKINNKGFSIINTSPDSAKKISVRSSYRNPILTFSTPDEINIWDKVHSEIGGAMLTSGQLMDKILDALEKREPLSVVSVGATEAFVMSQYTVLSEDELMIHPEALVANMGRNSGFEHRGVRIPNIAARDAAVEAARKADIVGYNTIIESAFEMTRKVFDEYSINPELVFEANLRRVIMFSQKEKFNAMLTGRKLLLIGSPALKLKGLLDKYYQDDLGTEIVGAIGINQYEEISAVKEQLNNYDYDLCLLAAGVNALILAPYIARTYGKVAFDIGWGMESLITGNIFMDQWLTFDIGIDNILKM